ncbi:MAG: HAMP domain-containing histidine kinase [Chloroflexi bacterium]|nr:HAMP domain-containing histidine kinase [Chloroflexota bacterium]
MAAEGEGLLPSSVIHELRTPLTAIHGYAQILQRAIADHPATARPLRVLLAESGRLTRLLNELSEAAELEHGGTPSSVQPVDVGEVVREIVDGLGQREEAVPGFRIEGDAAVTCDRRRLTQALARVMTNAARYSQPHEVVTVTIAHTENVVRVSVADTGIGVPAEDGEHIYGRYARGTNARPSGVRGLGLGLYVARAALAREGGRIWHESRQDGGTVFHLEMPAR